LFDDLKKKLKKEMEENERLSAAAGDLKEKVAEARTDISAATDGLTVKAKELSEKAKDAPQRAIGYIKGSYKAPRTEEDSTLFHDRTWFICSRCEARVGPIKTSKWEKMKENISEQFSRAKMAVGTAAVSPFLMASGTVKFAGTAGGDEGFIADLKRDRKNREEGRKFLVQCEYCGDWVCSSCWDIQKRICVKCKS